jgi:hypothetical protein
MLSQSYFFYIMTEDIIGNCREKFEKVVGCLKKAVDGMKKAFDSNEPGKHSSEGGL